MKYRVKLDVFEGPFDLLVYLIENANMSIYDIRVAEITAQYMAFIEKAKLLDVALASEFLVLAATLVELKSKMLLPRTKIDDEGNIEFEDPRNELVSRLLEYKRFKNAAELLEQYEEQSLLTFEKPKEDISRYTNEPDVYLSLDIKHFVTAFNQFLIKKRRLAEIKSDYAVTGGLRLTTEEKMDYIQNIFRLKNKKTVSFKDVLQSENDKYETVVAFAAILEMARLKAIKLRQRALFGDIRITERDKEDGEQKND